MDYSITPTPIQMINAENGVNHLYMKRDDLTGFSFGGNKVRLAMEFIQDMDRKHKDTMIVYGSSRSNLCRVMTNLCQAMKIPCHVITSVKDMDADWIGAADKEEDNWNSRLVRESGATVHTCTKSKVAETVKGLMDRLEKEQKMPYYIYGDEYGQGNEDTAAAAYEKAYQEILDYQKEQGIVFHQIFLASGTGMTHGGLIRGQLRWGGEARINGISIARTYQTGSQAVARYAGTDLSKISFITDYLAGGYGMYHEGIETAIQDMMENHGIPMDPTYSGKAWWGMQEYLKVQMVAGQNILFIHTGGIPLYFDYQIEKRKKGYGK